MRHPLRSILVATDLAGSSDAIIRSAALLAARTGADLHVVHALDLPARSSEDSARRPEVQDQVETAQADLREQVGQSLPAGIHAASQRTFVYAAHTAILDRAKEISADLIVVGPHRQGEVSAHFLGTTADRVIRAADVPCLVVGEPLADPIRRIGVPLDFSDPSQGALEIAFSWGVQASGGGEAAREDLPEIRVMHVGWPVEKADNPDMEEEMIRPEIERQIERALSSVPEGARLETGFEVVWHNDTTAATAGWAASGDIDLLVMGTRGSTGLTEVMLGSTASRVARQAPCPVLLVPPSLQSGRANDTRMDRVVIATDFSETGQKAARWSIEELAPDAEHLLVHALEVPEPPSVLAGRYGSREELLQTAREGARKRLQELQAALEAAQPEGRRPSIQVRLLEGRPAEEIVRTADEDRADLLVVGRHGRGEEASESRNLFGTTAERIVRASSVPVLVGGNELSGPPRSLLVAVDGSEPSRRALRWADFLRGRFGGSLTAVHVETPFIYEYADMVPESAELAEAAANDDAETPGWVRERETWLREQIQEADVDPGSTTLRVALGNPAVEILDEQKRIGADLIVVGTHGRSAFGRTLLGSVAGTVLRRASCPVLVVGDTGRTIRH